MRKHTPGPWEFVQGGSGSFPTWNVRIGSAHVCLPGCFPMEEMAANARLIAAAPDLLEALKECVCALETCGKDYRATELARAAIAKATGGAA